MARYTGKMWASIELNNPAMNFGLRGTRLFAEYLQEAAKRMGIRVVAAGALGLLMSGIAMATPTENQGISILPAPGPVTIDGNTEDWDLSGGIFTCDDVENHRDDFSVWINAMYDADNLYILARWNDATPMNNPGSTKGDYGFNGDCLQFRVVTNPNVPEKERVAHFGCWIDREGLDVIGIEYGRQFNEGAVPDAKSRGAKEAFKLFKDGKGYVQEVAIPWKLVLKEGQSVPKAGDKIHLTFESNFTVGVNGRLSVKDNFMAGVTPDRVFTFMTPPCWGEGTLEGKGHVPLRSVRLADKREFPVAMERGEMGVNWTGLIQNHEQPGFKPIKYTMPEDGFVSMHLKSADGTVVRQLMNNEFQTRGEHEVKWDGLTTKNWRTPGQVVAAGDYKWEAIWHKNIGLKLRGWADNAGSAPWDSVPSSNWGGDHGVPTAAATDGKNVYLGWNAAEAGKALIAVDPDAKVLWKVTHGGVGGALLVAVDHGTVYAMNIDGSIYRISAATGIYSAWAGTTSTDLSLAALTGDPKSGQPIGMAARDGKLYFSFATFVQINDGESGKLIKKIDIKAPGALAFAKDGKLLAVSEGKNVVAIDTESGSQTTLISGLQSATGLTSDAEGRILVGLRDPANQVVVYSAAGKEESRIGKAGGRALLGPWQPDGILAAAGLTVDPKGQLWVMEQDMSPKRVSVWNVKTGKLKNELFGPTAYGALGGAIDPIDPDLMVGQGCEWRIDPKTGHGKILGVINREGMQNSRYGIGANGKLYVAVCLAWAFDNGSVFIFERMGDGQFAKRASFDYQGQGDSGSTKYWADKNGDGVVQADEVQTIPGVIRFSSWYMNFNQDMAFTADDKEYKVSGFTACGAPLYDFAHPIKMPIKGVASADGKLVFKEGDYGVNEGWNRCFDIATGKLLWTYPDNFIGVHGSHNATPPEVGMIRGSYGACASVKLPEPIGNAWIIGTNVGEWHILTASGFYLTRLFEPDSMKFKWPEVAGPGAILDSVPCGMGGEDFGGNATVDTEGKLHLQAGKVGFWNVDVTGLETVKVLGSGSVKIEASDMALAAKMHDDQMQTAVGTMRLVVHQMTPMFTGNISEDFKGAQIVGYKKQEDAAVRTATAWDAKNLYVAWEVRDGTPWVNGATDATAMYIGGDTVDLQLGTNPALDPKRSEAGNGDLRLSIGNFQGKATAVIYRKVSDVKQPKVFNSGTVASYPMDFVSTVPGVEAKVTIRDGNYQIEAAIPLSSLGLKPEVGMVIHGDVGVTHGDPAGQRTRLRSYWNNQHTGIVDDAVYELRMEPMNWGEVSFEK